MSGATVLRIVSVPFLVKVDRTGTVLDVASPSIAGSWPPTSACLPGGSTEG